MTGKAMLRTLREVTMVLLAMAATIAFATITAYLSAFNVVQIWNWLDPIEPWESAGPGFARGLLVLGLVIPGGFMTGCVLMAILWRELANPGSLEEDG